MKTLIVTIICSTMALHLAYGKSFQRPQSNNYIKGIEALNAGDTEQAYQFLNSEIKKHPDNGYAHCYMALICNFYGDRKLALHAVNESLDLIPKEDKEYRSFAYYTRGMLLLNGKAYAQAITDLSEAIDMAPNDIENYKARAQAYMQEGKYEASLSDLQTVLRLDSHADVYDLMMKLIEKNPDPTFFEDVAHCYGDATAKNK